MTFKSLFLSFFGSMLLSAPALAVPTDNIWHGYIIDKQCADSVRHDADPSDFIHHHFKDCALMPNCQKKGYSLYTKGIWLDLDSRGNKLAIKLLQSSKRRSAFYVEVIGARQKNILQVKNMKETAEPKASAEPEEKH